MPKRWATYEEISEKMFQSEYKTNRKSTSLPAVIFKNCPIFRCWRLLILFSVLCLQRVPGGGGGGTSTQSTRHSRNPALLPSSHSLPECHAAKLAVLLHRSVPRRRHPLATAIHCGRQQDLQRLLERPSAASEELQHLLPGRQYRQRGGCFRLFLLSEFSLSVHAMLLPLPARFSRLSSGMVD